MALPQLIYGLHAVEEALKADVRLDRIMVRKGLKHPAMRSILQHCQNHRIPVLEVPGEKLDRTTRAPHQGIIAWRALIPYLEVSQLIPFLFEQGKSPLLVVLDRITDVRNFGAICRTALCMGADAVVIPARGGAQIQEDALKASAGALHHLPVCREWNLKESLQYMAEAGLTLVGVTEKGETTLWQGDFSGPVALVMGSEEDGISPAYLPLLHHKVQIPMSGPVGSLNVGAATAMALYEISRQRG